MKLEIELVPAPLWGKSLAGTLPKDRWMALRHRIIQEKGERCEICGQAGRVELHEIWQYDNKRHIQRLAGFQLLCLPCHQVKHIGRASILAKEGKLDLKFVVAHFCRINGCTANDYRRHEKKVREEWKERSKYKWTQDLSLLERMKS